MLQKSDLENIKVLIDDFKPRSTYFEKKILLPNMKFRILKIIETFEIFKEIAKTPGLAEDIGKALISTYDQYKRQLGDFQEPLQQGQIYLDGVCLQCDNSYIAKAKEILDSYPTDESDVDQTNEFINEAFNFFLRVVGSKEDAFMYQLRPTLKIFNVEKKSEAIIMGEQINFILRPFEARMNEMVISANMAIESIENWRVRIGQQQTKHIEIIYGLSNVKAAEVNLKVQLLVIVLTLVLTFGSVSIIDFWGTYQVNANLNKELIVERMTNAHIAVELEKERAAMTEFKKQMNDKPKSKMQRNER